MKFINVLKKISICISNLLQNNNNLRLKAQLFSDSGDESFKYEMTGPENDALIIGETVGQKLLDLAGDKFKNK